MNDDDLQQLIDRELKRLPTPRAPHTLLPRVLAAAAARQSAPWYTREWLAWPRVWQAVSAAGMVALAIAFVMFLRAPDSPAAQPAVRAAAAPQGAVAAIAKDAAVASAVVRVGWRLLVGPAVAVALIFTVSLSLACAVIWAALDRIALGASQQ